MSTTAKPLQTIKSWQDTYDPDTGSLQKQSFFGNTSSRPMSRSNYVASTLIKRAMSGCSQTEGTWKCSACDVSLKSKTALRTHMKGHLKQLDYYCTICEKQFWTSDDLEGHMSANHTNFKQHQCTLCSRGFSYRKTLVRHMRNDHPPT